MTKLDWEAELGVVIGKRVLDVAPNGRWITSLAIPSSTTSLNAPGRWSAAASGSGQSYPNFCPTGPYLVTADEVPGPAEPVDGLDVGGTRMQTGSTRNMIFDAHHRRLYERVLPA